MKLSQVAAQLFTVREHTRNASDLARTAARIRQIGYTAVQVSAVGPIPPSEIARIMADHGLIICATHEPSEEMLAHPERVVARLKELGCRLTSYPMPRGFDLENESRVLELVQRLNAVGAAFRAAGITLAYHNHAVEFIRFRQGTVLDFIYSNTQPENLAAELDSYWIQFGGGDVVDWCIKMKGRLPCIHLKDYRFTKANTPVFSEIGSGNLPFPQIIAAAEHAGCGWFIVEQDTCPGDPFDSLAQSFNHIRSNLIVS
jgi:sugar phosphate isomerase/epimerase